MANKQIFKSFVGKMLPAINAVNEAQGSAYALGPEQALAQYAMTGCMNSTFYASAGEQLTAVLKLAEQVSPEFIAKLAVYAREQGFMKDLPALFCAILSTRDANLLKKIFPRVIDSGKMLRNFVQIMRSGAVGRKSLGSVSKRLVQEWLSQRGDTALFRDSLGNSPSLADVINIVHPKPENSVREALYAYLLGKECEKPLLPRIVQEYEAFKHAPGDAVPDVPFNMLTSLSIGKNAWKEIAKNAPWQTTRMNLNTFLRHGVFEDERIVELIAERLKSNKEIERAKVFPYQFLAAYHMAGDTMPQSIREALQDGLEIAIENVTALPGRVVVCPDVSGSMSSPVTGVRKGASTAVRCVDVAALVAAAIVRKNPRATVLPFEAKVVSLQLNSRDSVVTNAKKLASVCGGGTACSAPLAMIYEEKLKADLVLLVSDNQSWVDRNGACGTATMREWEKCKARNPQAKLVCLDIQPYKTVQAIEREDILNIGGFSDHVFEVISQFAENKLNCDHFTGVINAMEL